MLTAPTPHDSRRSIASFTPGLRCSQDLDAESQRLIYPILRLKMVQHILFAALKDSRKKGTDFITSVRQKSLTRMLEKVRDELNNDPDNAMRIEREWFNTVQSGIEHEAKKKPKKSRQVQDAGHAWRGARPWPPPLTLGTTAGAGAAGNPDASDHPVGCAAAHQRQPQVQGGQVSRGAHDVLAGVRGV